MRLIFYPLIFLNGFSNVRLLSNSSNFIAFAQHIFISISCLLTLGLPFKNDCPIPVLYVQTMF